MKKCFVILFSLLLIGCSSANISDVKPIINNFECQFKIVDDDLSGKMMVEKDGTLHLEFETPSNISGTKLTVDSTSLTVDVLGLSKKFDRDNIPDDADIVYIYESLISSENIHLTEKGENITAHGSCDKGQFVIYFDTLGKPISIELIDVERKIELSNIISLN